VRQLTVFTMTIVSARQTVLEYVVVSTVAAVKILHVQASDVNSNSSATPDIRNRALRASKPASQADCSLSGVQSKQLNKHKNVQAHFVVFISAWLNCKKIKKVVDI